MARAMVVSAKVSNAPILASLLHDLVECQVDACGSAAQARRQLGEMEYQLVLVDAPLGDEFGVDFALDMEEKYDCSVVMLVVNELFDEIQSRLDPAGVLCLAKPVNKQVLLQSVRVVISYRQNLLRLREENRMLAQKLADTHLLNRAKFCLVECLKMTEDAAHRYIQKQAMDMRTTQRAVAESILKTYEL